MASKIKLSFEGENRILSYQDQLKNVIAKAQELFSNRLPAHFKLYYYDSERDLILISNQDDYEQACLIMKEAKKFYLAEGPEGVAASKIFPPAIDKPKTAEKPNLDKAEVIQSIYMEVPAKQQTDPLEIQKIEQVKEIKEPEKKPELPKKDSAKEKTTKEEKHKSEKVVDPVQVDIYACLYCEGRKKTKGGKACPACKGSGKIPDSYLEKIRNIVKREISNVLEPEFFLSASQMFEKKPLVQVFPSSLTKCSGCGTAPIPGNVFLCTLCSEVRFCAKCKEGGVHPHYLTTMGLVEAPEKISASEIPKSGSVYRIEAKKEAKKYNSRCESNLKDKHPAKPGENIEIIWTVENTGKHSWPSDTRFTLISGDKIEYNFELVGEVQPQQKKATKGFVKAPSTPGRYVATFILMGDKEKSFGNKPWVDIVVSDSP